MAVDERVMAAPTTVYRLFSASGVLLYVGVAINPEARIANHLYNKPWRYEIDRSRTRVEWFENRTLALLEERRAIAGEKPLYNIAESHRLPRPRGTRPPETWDYMRKLRVDRSLWIAYTEIVGDGGRSADLRSYMEWRIDHPTTPLPGRRRGPVRKVRQRHGEQS